jgi:hypothetical protein
MFKRVTFAAAASLSVCLAASPACAHRTALDDGLYSLYDAPSDGSEVDLLVCGRVGENDGCYKNVRFVDAESACAVIEGAPSEEGNVVTRAIYILDRRAANGDPLQLFVYDRTDTIADNYDTVRVTMRAQIPLHLKGSPKGACMLAANDRFLYAGSSRDKAAVSIAKDTLVVAKIHPESLAKDLTEITADDRGYVAVCFGEYGCSIFSPDGSHVGESSPSVMATTRNSFKPGL